jgi:hypothetical protein
MLIAEDWRTPPVCLIHAAQPIVTPSCRKGPNQVVVHSGKETYVLTIIAILLGVWFGFVAMCAVFCCVRRKAATVARKGQIHRSF